MVHPENVDRVERENSTQIGRCMDLDYTEFRILTEEGNVKNMRDYGEYAVRVNGSGIFYVMISELQQKNTRCTVKVRRAFR